MARVREQSYDVDKEILATSHGLRSPIHRSIDDTLVTANVSGYKPILPGTFFCESGVEGMARPLPRGKVTEAATTASTSVKVDLASYFTEGDELVVIPPYRLLTLTGTWAANDTLTTVIGGDSITATAAGSSKSAIATLAATNINSDASLSDRVTAIASGDAIYIYSSDSLTQYSLTATATTAGDGDVTVSGTPLLPNTPIGIVDAVDVATGALALTSTAAVALPVGMPIGIVAKPIGMLATGLDLTYDSLDQGFYVSATVYGQRLPYWDGELARRFPEIVLV